ncbi:MAG: M18 family aminopeptidase [Actinomycetaceae bacterium]|nr:M18 family aminopeptidase [Actinomycetaceae bacterium]
MTTLPSPDHTAHAEDFARFITSSPSSYHAAAEVTRRLIDLGFTQLDEAETFTREPGTSFVVRDGAVIAWIIPEGESPAGFRIVGSHTDSPALKVKPSGSHVTADGWGQIDVEIYGGMLLNSWLDRELGFAGRIIDRAGTSHLVSTGPVARVPQLAIHLDREVTTKGLTLDKQRHMQPVWTFPSSDVPCIFDHLAEIAGIGSADTISGHDLVSFTTEAPAIFGDEGEFFAAGRQDNLSSVHASLVAFENIVHSNSVGSDIAVFAAFDHEEVGSSTRSGAAGPFLETVLRRLALTYGGDDHYYRMLAQSTCISADAAHSVHPNYDDRHDPRNKPVPGHGPVLKVNANQRYATDATGSALFDRICLAADVPYQTFVSNNSVPCGSTIGPFIATRIGIPTVDVGIGLLSMHSAREMSHVSDHYYLSSVLTSYWEGA